MSFAIPPIEAPNGAAARQVLADFYRANPAVRGIAAIRQNIVFLEDPAPLIETVVTGLRKAGVSD